MIVQQKMKAKLLSCLGQRDGVFQIVWKFCWRVEQPQPNPVVAVVLENHESWFRFAVVFENFSLVFGLLEEGKVGPNGVLRRA